MQETAYCITGLLYVPTEIYILFVQSAPLLLLVIFPGCLFLFFFRLSTFHLLNLNLAEYILSLIHISYETGLTSVFLPEFDRMMETPQNNPHHIYSVGDHTIHAVETIAPNPILRLTMLLHDIAKPETRSTDENGIDHFYNHNEVGAVLSKTILRRLKFDNQTIQMVTTLIAHHDIRFNDALGTGRKHVRRVIHSVGENLFPYLLDVMEADISAQSDFMRLKKLTALKETRQAYHEILAANDCLTLKDLKINGNQLKALGISEGKIIGAILNALLSQVLNNPELNDYEKLKELALKIYQEVQ